jgi:DNA-binding MarR family transcriptional regulator
MSQRRPFRLDAFLPYQLAVLSSRVSAEFARVYGERFGLSLAEWRILAHLSTLGAQETVSTREVFERVDLDKTAVSRAAARLDAAGLIEKRRGGRDARLVEMRLTEEGRALMAEIAPVAREFEADFLARLGETEGADFRRLVAEALAATKR